MKKDTETDEQHSKTSKVFLASNGFDRGIPDVSKFGTLVHLCERRIDPHLNFAKLNYTVRQNLLDFKAEDFILIGNCSLTLLLAFSYISSLSIQPKVLFYDQLTHDLQQYTYNGEEDQWTTTLTTLK